MRLNAHILYLHLGIRQCNWVYLALVSQYCAQTFIYCSICDLMQHFHQGMNRWSYGSSCHVITSKQPDTVMYAHVMLAGLFLIYVCTAGGATLRQCLKL